jgi:hypothetical protein
MLTLDVVDKKVAAVEVVSRWDPTEAPHATYVTLFGTLYPGPVSISLNED